MCCGLRSHAKIPGGTAPGRPPTSRVIVSQLQCTLLESCPQGPIRPCPCSRIARVVHKVTVRGPWLLSFLGGASGSGPSPCNAEVPETVPPERLAPVSSLPVTDQERNERLQKYDVLIAMLNEMAAWCVCASARACACACARAYWGGGVDILCRSFLRHFVEKFPVATRSQQLFVKGR